VKVKTNTFHGGEKSGKGTRRGVEWNLVGSCKRRVGGNGKGCTITEIGQ